jgi:hypothetical protein
MTETVITSPVGFTGNSSFFNIDMEKMKTVEKKWKKIHNFSSSSLGLVSVSMRNAIYHFPSELVFRILYPKVPVQTLQSLFWKKFIRMESPETFDFVRMLLSNPPNFKYPPLSFVFFFFEK